MPKAKFGNALTTALHRQRISNEELTAICVEYGIGPEDTHFGGYQEVRWLDFLADVQGA